jgi:hypothetical protein
LDVLDIWRTSPHNGAMQKLASDTPEETEIRAALTLSLEQWLHAGLQPRITLTSRE